jgi:hypothetical protein
MPNRLHRVAFSYNFNDEDYTTSHALAAKDKINVFKVNTIEGDQQTNACTHPQSAAAYG